MAERKYKISLIITGEDAGASSALGKVGKSLDQITNIAGGMLLARGVEAAVSGIMNMGASAINSASQMQNLGLSLNTLAAREMVMAGEAETVEQALGMVGNRAGELEGQLRDLSLISPFQFQTVSDTFRLQMAFGATSKTAMELTGAILDTAAGLGLTEDATGRLAYNFGQINSVGKIMGTDLRQLRMVGLDLADVFESELAMSVDQVNAALETGKLTMEDVSGAFVTYADKNFGGAAERMSKTFSGIQSSLADLALFAGSDAMGAPLVAVTGFLNDLYTEGRALADSGYFLKLGEEIGEATERILDGLIDLSGGDISGMIVGLGDGFAGLAEAVAEATEWLANLSPFEKDMIKTTGMLVLALGPAAQGVRGMTSAINLAATGFTAAQMAAMSYTAALALVAVAAYKAYELNQQVEQGVRDVSEAWTESLVSQAQAGADTNQVMSDYIANAGEIQHALDNVNESLSTMERVALGAGFEGLVKLFVGSDIIEGGQEALSQALLRTTQSYEQYIDAMMRGAVASGQLDAASANLYRDMIRNGEATEFTYRNLGVYTREAYTSNKATVELNDAWQASNEELALLTKGVIDQTDVQAGLPPVIEDVTSAFLNEKAAMDAVQFAIQGPLTAAVNEHLDTSAELWKTHQDLTSQLEYALAYGWSPTSKKVMELKAALLENEQAQRASYYAMQAATREMIFQQAAAGLDAAATLELARSMGQISEQEYILATTLQNLKAEYDLNADGILSADEAARGYTEAAGAIAQLPWDPENVDNYREAVEYIKGAAADGYVSLTEMYNAMLLLDGKEITATVNLIVKGTIPDFGVNDPDGTIPGEDGWGDGSGNGGAQAWGGEYLVSKPTWFLAGEAGPEYASFAPMGSGAWNRHENQAGEGGYVDQSQVTINNEAAMAMFLEEKRQQKKKAVEALM